MESPPSNIDAVRGQIWKTKIHEHFKILLWRIAANLLPSKEIISRFNESMDLCCPLCNSAVETTLHLFMVCPFSKSLWFQSQQGLRMEVFNFESPSKFVNFLLSPNFVSNLLPSQREEFLLFGAILCDVVWKQRNLSIFENMDINLEGVATRIFNLFVEHKSARPPPREISSFCISLGLEFSTEAWLKNKCRCYGRSKILCHCCSHKRLERECGICWFKESEHYHPSSS